MDSGPLTVRPYEHGRDAGAITEMCKTVYGGHDYLPRLLPSLSQNPLSFPFVLASDNRDVSNTENVVVACAILRKMHADGPAPFFLEAVRVDPRFYAKGLGRRVVEEAMAMVRAQHGHNLNFVSVTIAGNKAMMRILRSQRVFREKTCRLWPDFDRFMALEDHDQHQPMLDSLGLEVDINGPDDYAVLQRELLDLWKPVVARQQLINFLGSDFVPHYFELDTAQGVWDEIEVGTASAWILDQRHRGLLVVRENPRISTRCQTIASVCSKGCINVAESAAWFAEKRLMHRRFRIVLDNISSEQLALSPMFKVCQPSSFEYVQFYSRESLSTQTSKEV
jgi:GNAT superfamily N-acetyltransferase